MFSRISSRISPRNFSKKPFRIFPKYFFRNCSRDSFKDQRFRNPFEYFSQNSHRYSPRDPSRISSRNRYKGFLKISKIFQASFSISLTMATRIPPDIAQKNLQEMFEELSEELIQRFLQEYLPRSLHRFLWEIMYEFIQRFLQDFLTGSLQEIFPGIGSRVYPV